MEAGARPPERSHDLRAAREAMLADSALTGLAWCRRLAAAADAWLRGLVDRACNGDTSKVALIAVGGYGRGELAPASDLDLLLVHDRGRRVKEIADAIWYPVWDAGVSLDHSVRTAREVRSAMDSDIKVALGLLDARFVAGDAGMAAGVLQQAAELWQKRAIRWLPAVDEVTRERHVRFDDLAFLLEPNLKESRGGLRDLTLLRSLGRVVPLLAEVLDESKLGTAGEVLAGARVELQRPSARPVDVLLLQDQDRVASALGYPDADDLMMKLATAGRDISWANDDGWRRLESWIAGPRGRSPGTDRPLEPGLVIRDGEVTLRADADPSADPSLALRASAASATLDLPLARSSLDRLGASAVAPDGVWTAECLDALLRLLGAGRPAVAAIEALDQVGVWLRYLPEWEHVRNRPQRNAYHRYTVDRHLLETATTAAGLQHSVGRPDLLLLGSLLHDIGKGVPGEDHCEAGVRISKGLGARLGLSGADVDILVALVRLHLLLPESATRRDLDDPATAAGVAAAVGDPETLALLAALTEADSLATGPTAWSEWKAGLVSRLVREVAAVFEGLPRPDRRSAAASALGDEDRALIGSGRLELRAKGSQVVVAAPDRAGLLAIVAGVLTLSGASVRSATTLSYPEVGMALMRFDVAPAFVDLPDWGEVHSRLEAAVDGRLDVRAALDERATHYAGARRAISATRPGGVQVILDNSASTTSTVVEVHALDRAALLHVLTQTLSAAGVSISCALVNTVGAEAIDVFYVESLDGSKVTDQDGLERIERAVRRALQELAL